MRLGEARELVDMLDAVGRHNQVTQLRIERFLRARGYDQAADRVASEGAASAPPAAVVPLDDK